MIYETDTPVRLSDRNLAVIIDCLQNERDRVRRDFGLPGKDCQDVLDLILPGMKQTTNGAVIALIQADYQEPHA